MSPEHHLSQHFLDIVNKYKHLRLINGQEIHSPYWMNKIVKGKVVLRGEYNGKGTWEEIQESLNNALKIEQLTGKILTNEQIEKLARRHKIGIDCSGFAFRILASRFRSVNKLFPLGINKTNARALTNDAVTEKIIKSKDIQPGDLVKMMGGSHVLIILQNDSHSILYVHSAGKYTQTKGVHEGVIKIINPEKGLEYQTWEEKTKTGENFGKKYFNPEKGDSVKRLKKALL